MRAVAAGDYLGATRLAPTTAISERLPEFSGLGIGSSGAVTMACSPPRGDGADVIPLSWWLVSRHSSLCCATAFVRAQKHTF